MSSVLSRAKRLVVPSLVAIAASAIVVWILWPLLSETVHGRHASEREVRDFVDRVHVDQPAEDVARVWEGGRYQKLTIRSRTDREWWIATPAQIGASDWIVRLQFERGRVIAVPVGSTDQADVTPSRAPASKQR
jgi:hypothetical protein